ncbi:MAG TPA: hypothetical protein VGB98_04995 [Pyrinomonadaceae bacterium]|jgi:hypothetical protein
MRAFLLTLILLCAAPAAHAQAAPAREPGRRVTVNMRKGEPVSGAFLGADGKSVSVESDGERLTFDLDNVASLVFTRPGPDSPAARAVEALKSLSPVGRAAASAARDYRNRFLEVKAVVDDQLPLIPEGDLREAIGDVLKAFELASEISEQASQSKPSEEAARMTNDALRTTLSNARKRLEQAEALLPGRR